MKRKSGNSFGTFGLGLGLALALAGTYIYRGPLRSAAIRKLSHTLADPAKARGIGVDLGPGIPGWNRITLVGQMGKTLPDVVGHPVEAVAFSRFGGFNLSRTVSDFQNPNSPNYQSWYGAYIVFDNEHRQRFGFDTAGEISFKDAIDALEADQRLVYANAGIPLTFEDGRLVRFISEGEREEVELHGENWQRLTGLAETRSTYHRGSLPLKSWKFNWTYGSVPYEANHGVNDMHRLTYRGEFWARYEPAWQASLCKFFIYPSYKNQQGLEVDKGTPWLISAGQSALADIRFYKLSEA